MLPKSVLTLVALAACWPCLAAIPGADQFIRNAERVIVVRAQSNMEAIEYPPPAEQQFLIEPEVLKGVDTRQYFLVPAKSVEAGQQAILIFNPACSNISDSLDQVFPVDPVVPLVWPLDATGKITREIPAATARNSEFEHATLADVRKLTAKLAPQDVKLSADAIDWCIFPDRVAKMEKRNPSRATYVSFIVSIYDLNRDVLALSELLESSSVGVRAATEERLHALTGADIAPTETTYAKILHAHALAWRKWWSENKSTLEWNAKTHTWTKSADSLSARRWPPIPEDKKLPADDFPAPLLSAVYKCDAHAFADAFAVWLDSGVMRDRQARAAFRSEAKLLSNDRLLEFGPLNPGVILDTNLPAASRMKAICYGVLTHNHARFALERREALTLIKTLPEEALKRAAFWDIPAIQSAAQERLDHK